MAGARYSCDKKLTDHLNDMKQENTKNADMPAKRNSLPIGIGYKTQQYHKMLNCNVALHECHPVTNIMMTILVSHAMLHPGSNNNDSIVAHDLAKIVFRSVLQHPRFTEPTSLHQ